ncbi:head GIN domain-containing protein [Spirosoma sp. KUDC1026]|uniref:head GIN domain-containing protein n=1 Tax=Spirosoma sp. KUDC1026 TaxID=2745947 RepID=UPI00159B92BD|nr:head GIN domain-containing protein [Spirosoma sp. KUDC1026]QKZ12360.1 DUF2807 domain-containing protein [Spirosoma sp. KUDC1026]
MKTLLLATAFFVTSLHAADDWKKSRPVSDFTGLSVSSGIDLYLTQGSSEKLTFDVKGVDEEDVKSEIKNGVLKLYIERNGMNWGFNFGRSKYVKAYVTFKQLSNLAASGGADVFGEGNLSFNNLNMSVSGGSDLTMNLKANDLNVSVSGGADAVLEGSAKTLNASSSGGADLDARRLTASVCTANASGGADVYVKATQELTMKASGGSDIYYYGPAKVVTKSKSGGSDITQKD